MACGIWESLNHRKVGICVEGQTAASAHERGKGALTHRCPEWWRGNWFAFRGTRTMVTRPFFHRLPPTGKLKKKRRSPQETQFIFLSTSSHFSFLLSIHIKKTQEVLKGTKCKQKSSWLNHDTNFCKPQFCLCVTTSLLPAPHTWPASIRS